jgi:chromosome segregation ATPase
MSNPRKLATYGGFIAVPVVAAAFFLISKGIGKGLIPAIMILIFGSALFTLFAAQVKPRIKSLDNWIEGRPKEEKAREDQLKPIKDARAAADELVKEEPFLQRAAKRLITFLRSIPKRNTVGDQSAALKDVKPDVLNDLIVEKTKSLRYLSIIVDSLEKERRILSDNIEKTKKNRKEFRQKEMMIRKNLALYQKVLSQGIITEESPKGESGRKLLRNLEETLKEDWSEEAVKDLRVEAEQAKSNSDYVTNLGKRIGESITDLSKAILPEWRDRHYEEMTRSLDRMSGAVGKLAPAAEEHRSAVIKLWESVRKFEKAIVANTCAQLAEIMKEEGKKSRLAALESAAARAERDSLKATLDRATTDISSQASKIAKQEQQLGDLTSMLSGWQRDLDAAKRVAEKDTDKNKDLMEILSKNAKDQSSLASKLVDLVLQERSIAMRLSANVVTAQNGELKAAEVERALKEEIRCLTSERDAAVEKERALTEQIKVIEDEKRIAIESARQGTLGAEEAKRRVGELEFDIQKAKRDIEEVKAIATAAEREKTSRESELREAAERHAEMLQRLSKSEADRRFNEEQLARATLRAEQLDKLMRDESDKLKNRISLLEAENRNLVSEASASERELRNARSDLASSKAELEKTLNGLNTVLGRKGSVEVDLLGAKDANRELQKELDSLKAAQGSLQKQLAQAREDNGKVQLELAAKGAKSLERLRKVIELQKALAAANALHDSEMLNAKKSKESLLRYVNKLNAQLKSAKEELDSKKNELKGVPKEDLIDESRIISALEDRVTSKVAELTRANTDLKKANARIEELEKEMMRSREVAKSREAALNDNLAKTEDASRAAANALNEIRQEHERILEELAAAREESSRLDGMVKSTESRIAQERDRNAELQARITALDTQIHTGASNRQQLIGQRDALVREHERIVAQMATDAEGLKGQLAMLHGQQAKITEENERLRELSKSIDPLKVQITALSVEKQDLEGQVSILTQRENNLKSEKDNLARELASVTERNVQLLAQAVALPEMRDQARQMKEEMEEQLAARQAELGRISEELIQTRADLKLAVSSEDAATKLSSQAQELEISLKEENKRISQELDLKKEENRILGEELEAVKQAHSYSDVYGKILSNLLKATVSYTGDPAGAMVLLKDIIAAVQSFIGTGKTTPEQEQNLRYCLALAEQIKEEITNSSLAQGSTQVIELPVPRVIAVGDSHGDYERLVAVLVRAGVIDAKHNWTANPATKVILMGDYIDRGPATFELLSLIMTLKKKAGDNLVLLIGNHEAMFLGAFDWVGYDDDSHGRKMLEWYSETKKIFDGEIEKLTKKRREKTDADTDKVLQMAEFADFRSIYLRVEYLKHNWWFNDRVKGSMESSVCSQLGIETSEALHNPKMMLDKEYRIKDSDIIRDAGTDHVSVRKYIEFLRDNLETFSHDEDTNVFFIHAGIPYEVKIHGAPDEVQEKLEVTNFSLRREPTRFIGGGELHSMLMKIQNAIKDREVELWMSFSEKSPLFADNPPKRNLPWNNLPGFSEDKILATFGFNALVYGHSYYAPKEEAFSAEYRVKPRRIFCIDFGMSRHYNKSHGGWLSLYGNHRVEVNIMDDSDPKGFRTYAYTCAPNMNMPIGAGASSRGNRNKNGNGNSP